MSKLTKNIIIGIVLIIILATGYVYFFNTDTETSFEVLQSESEVAPVAQSLLGALLTLESLKLDTSIFADKVFESLTDFSQPIPEQEVSRRNPFAPLGSDGASGTTTTR